MEWLTLERPGHLGRIRDEIHRRWNRTYGEGNWRITYEWGSLVIPKRFALHIYEDGYYEFLRENTEKLDWLLTTASDVFDSSETNVRSGIDYEVQETPNEHLQDIAIRRVVLRLGKEFRGDRLVEVRHPGSEGYEFTPGVVAFHLPDMIAQEEVRDYPGLGVWWQERSIEDFWQRNKLLQIKRGETSRPSGQYPSPPPASG